jgi:type II secretion system protein H
MNKQKQNTKAGFTLIELLVVIAIIALIGGVGGGFYIGTYKRMLVEKAARDFFLAAKYARIMAIEQQRPYMLQLDTTNGGFYLVYNALNEETGQTQQTIVRDPYSRPVEFVGDVKFEDVQITPLETESSDQETAIVFSPNGTAQTAVIQIGDGENHYTASVCAATGKAVIYPGTSKEAEAGTIDLDEE